MFITRKSLAKIWVLTGAYLALSTLCFLISILFCFCEIECGTLLVLGSLCLAASPLVYAIGRYSEGKGKLIAKGNKLLLHQLRPGEFIRLYEEKRDDPGNVVSKPDFEVLQLLAVAYDALGDTDRALESAEKMLLAAPEKKRKLAMLSKCSLLYSIGKSEEAEPLYREAISGKLTLSEKALSDVLMKSDRALALGDDTTAEAYFRQGLSQTFPRRTPLALLYDHYHLAKICYRTNRMEEAEEHLNYCIQNGGETNTQRKCATREIFQ